MSPTIQAARVAFARKAWREASRAFEAAASAERALNVDDYEQLAVASYLAGEDDRCMQAWEAAYRAALDDGDRAAAARSAVLLALCLVLRGQMAHAGGWVARAQELLEGCSPDCAASGYVLIPKILGALDDDPGVAAELAGKALAIAKRAGDADLCALAVLGHGQALLRVGNTAAGLARLDNVMVSVAGGEIGPIVTGIVYCAVIVECMKVHDLARASEWTTALSHWCDDQPDLVPFRGQCNIHRAQLHQVAGRWADALTAAEAACRYLSDPPHPALGFAYYQEGEVHRLRGDLDRAEAAYRAASGCGFDPVPGLPLLTLARGNAAVAASSINRALGEATDPFARAPLLVAATEILRATGDLKGARQAAMELSATAGGSLSASLKAMASHAFGTVLVAEGNPVAGLVELRAASRGWQSLRMPYEGALTATAIALACEALGDQAAAGLERENALAAFRALGAMVDVDRLAQRGGRSPLSARETEVLVHLATGKTNREIADALVISQHTVGRHVESIFSKLGVSSRSAATAYAYEHGLLSQR